LFSVIIIVEKEAFMSARHLIFVLTALVAGAGVNQFLFPPMKAKAAPPRQASEIMDVRALMETINVEALPRQDILSEADE
jgi:hypothetical protein